MADILLSPDVAKIPYQKRNRILGLECWPAFASEGFRTRSL